MRCLARIGWSIVVLVAFGLSLTAKASGEDEIFLHQIPQVSGISFDAANASEFRMATPYGMFLIAADGRAERLSEGTRALTALVRHPTLPSTFFSSGYRSKTEKLGVVRSDDGGRTWTTIAAGAAGPVAFHSMAISTTHPSMLYGVDEEIQLSRDGGRTWTSMGPAPGNVFDIAVSSKDPATLFAATQKALRVSKDGGRSWQQAHPSMHPVSMVNVTPEGRIHVFVFGTGLLAADELTLDWTLVSDGFQDRALIDVAIDPGNVRRMLGVADTGAVMTSGDGGRTWTSFEGSQNAAPQIITEGKGLYAENCKTCHGVAGVGENPEDMYATDEFGFKAPALNDDAHAWHHSDRDLVKTILDGSSRNERMIAWKDHLSRGDAEIIVAYIKSLWSFRSVACQGARHMRCMQ